MQPKPWYQSRTLWVNALIVLAFVLDQVTHTIAIPPDGAAWLAVAVATVNMVLRLITGAPLTAGPGD